ncbi:TPA: hypothetical protein K8030_002401 [Staphylococcus pseudintermedius]|nr:hypothetical protein [Staphylococcus pseudintermedius]
MNIKNALNNKITLLNALSSHQPTLTKNPIILIYATFKIIDIPLKQQNIPFIAVSI